MARLRTLDDLDVKGKRVLLRVDFNVPMKDGQVGDLSRISRAATTIAELAKKGAKVILLSHFGRPKGQRVDDLSLSTVALAAAQVLAPIKCGFANDCIGQEAAQAVAALGEGEVVLLENLRFHAGEEANDPTFVKALAKLGDLYVNDAFSAAHRAHASTEGLAHVLPSAAGRLLEEELFNLGQVLDRPARPVGAVVGGAKISTKLDLLGNLIEKVDLLIIGGGMANTFLHAQGIDVGMSLCEKDLADVARAVMKKAEERGCRIRLPGDALVAPKLGLGVKTQTVMIDKVPSDQMILDIGPQSAAYLAREIEGLKTLVWNGPLGCFEVPPFDGATSLVARKAAQRTKDSELLSVAGGGDTVAALAHAGVLDAFSYVSTAGGAFLEWLEGKSLPGVEALRR